MKSEDRLKEFEKYSACLSCNRLIEGPLFAGSVAYILLYTLALILWMMRPGLLDPFSTYMGFGFVFFAFAIYVGFTGLMLRRIR